MKRVTIIDYGLGNLHSVAKAWRFVGCDVSVTDDPDVVAKADRLVLPGVGAFGDGAQRLRSRGLDAAVLAATAAGRPLLGICLGMQLLFSRSDEFGVHAGLDIIGGDVVRIAERPGVKVPHVGWNRIRPPSGRSWSGSILEQIEPGEMVYFVHSYAAVPTRHEQCIAETSYADAAITAAVRRENVFGCQFHPEKSGPVGLSILERFLTI